ncbi:Hypothetical protein ETEE_3279 [Edwardsiella anguillarum ET080813]|uniref:Uncharacterized protein n=1 Tax=Edwardsiella anguillarum ET080813 TaxID=667120 RepID=A0A076LT66_9GAMM|nr:Hypothetical protein ETEE_3279 [Edwardsiella anguillarum ET080813]
MLCINLLGFNFDSEKLLIAVNIDLLLINKRTAPRIHLRIFPTPEAATQR